MTALTILHTNDTHSYLDYFGERAFLIEKVKRENEEKGKDVLVLGSGDLLSGNIYFNIYQGTKEAELVNLLNYDAITLGNHEFDDGSETLANYIKNLRVPIVSSNVHFENDKYIAPLEGDGHILPYLLKEMKNGKKIGIFGLTTLETIKNGYPSAETVFDSPSETARIMVKKLKSLGADLIILVSHLGDEADIALARAVSGIQVIVGGHTHKLFKKGLLVNDTIIVQAGYYGKYMGELRIDFDDESGEVTDFKEKIHEISKYKVKNSLLPFINKMKHEKEKVAGERVTFSKEKILGGRYSFMEAKAALGNIITDAYFYEAVKEGYAPDLAILNSFGIRTDLPAGMINYGDLVQVLPFSKFLVLIKVTGKQLKQSLEHGLAPQVSHLRLSYEGNPEGQKKLIKAEILKEGKYQSLQAEASYLVATNSFVGAGKDGFDGFEASEKVADKLKLDVDLLRDYLQSFPEPFEYQAEKRIQYFSKN